MTKQIRPNRKSSQTELSILRMIQASPAISRVELSDQSGLSSAAITGVIGALIRQGLLTEKRISGTAIGRKRVALKLHASLGCVMGIDLGTYNLRIVVTDLNGETLVSRSFKSEMSRGREMVLERCFTLARQTLADAGDGAGKLLGVGIAFSGVIDVHHGVILSYPRLGQVEQWRNIPLRNIAEREFGVPCMVEDSVRGVATSEKFMGRGQSLQDFVYVDVGVGIGASIFINGKIYRGYNGGAGEFGHMTVDENGPLCCCGSNGCLEAMASGSTIIEAARIAIQKGVASKISTKCDGNLGDITLEIISEAAEQNDSLAYRVLSDAATHIGFSCADLVNLLNPQAIIFGGALFRAAPDLLIEQIQRMVRQRAMEKMVNEVSLELSALSGDAGAYGMARLMAAHLIPSVYERVEVGIATQSN